MWYFTRDQKFCATSVPASESTAETFLCSTSDRCWVQPDQLSKEPISELMILKQLLGVLPVDVRTWVKEHEPEHGLTTTKLTLQYVNAHWGGSACFTNASSRTALQPAQHKQTREASQEPKCNPTSYQPSKLKPSLVFPVSRQAIWPLGVQYEGQNSPVLLFT